MQTTPVTQETKRDRIELKNLAKEAIRQLHAGGAETRYAAAIAEQLDDLVDDDEFWRFQAHGLAVLATPENVRTFRVPNALQPLVMVADRFHLKPLIRAISFPHSCYVLALAQRSVRVIEVSPDLPAVTIAVEGMPQDAGRAVRAAGEIEHWPSGRIQGAEGQKVLLRQFARNVDKALRPLLSGSNIPLILAATEPLASIYRSVNTYSHLTKTTISGSPQTTTDAQLGQKSRTILDGLYLEEIAAWRRVFEARENQGRATTDIAQAARAATMGAVELMLADIDDVIPGRIDDAGSVTFVEQTTQPTMT